MVAFTKWGRIAVAAGAVAVLSMNTVLMESPKPVERCEAEGQTKRAAAAASAAAAAAAAVAPVVEEKKVAENQGVRRSKAPKMAPQFDGLNFYETFIGSAQR